MKKSTSSDYFVFVHVFVSIGIFPYLAYPFLYSTPTFLPFGPPTIYHTNLSPPIHALYKNCTISPSTLIYVAIVTETNKEGRREYQMGGLNLKYRLWRYMGIVVMLIQGWRTISWTPKISGRLPWLGFWNWKQTWGNSMQKYKQSTQRFNEVLSTCVTTYVLTRPRLLLLIDEELWSFKNSNGNYYREDSYKV